MYEGTPIFGNVIALEGLARDWEIQGQQHGAHMLQACGLGSSQSGTLRQRPPKQADMGGNVKRFRGGLVFKAHRLLYHSTLGSKVIHKEGSNVQRPTSGFGWAPVATQLNVPHINCNAQPPTHITWNVTAPYAHHP